MRRIHIIGRKNHGKTTLVTELISELAGRGWTVGTIKHTHHHHELDTPGKDSHRHRVAGSARIGILSPDMNACFWPSPLSDGEARYESFAPLYADCDLVLVEGDTKTSARRIEVWRADAGGQPLSVEDETIGAVITDDVVQVKCPVLSRAKLVAIADWTCDQLQLSRRPG